MQNNSVPERPSFAQSEELQKRMREGILKGLCREGFLEEWELYRLLGPQEPEGGRL